MLVIRKHQFSIMVMFAIILHVWWALMIIVDASAVQATALEAVSRYIQPPLFLAFVIIATAVMAVIAVIYNSAWIIIFLIPQQAISMMGAAGAIEAIWLAQFADGTIRPRIFIATDQMYAVFVAIGHTIAVISLALRRLEEEAKVTGGEC